jgi:hypothetical protein
MEEAHVQRSRRYATKAGPLRAALLEKPVNRRPAMTGPACRPVSVLAPIAEREQRADRLAELLECMADLLVQARIRREEIAEHHSTDDSRVREAVARLTALERSISEVGIEAASVHQLLQSVHLI